MTATNTITYSLASEFFGPERALETSGVILFAYGSGYVLGSLVGNDYDILSVSSKFLKGLRTEVSWSSRYVTGLLITWFAVWVPL